MVGGANGVRCVMRAVPVFVVALLAPAAGVGTAQSGDGSSSQPAVLDRAFGPTTSIWIDRDVILGLPTFGRAWEAVREQALADWGKADVSSQGNQHDLHTLAGALYAVRMNDTEMRRKVALGIVDAMNTDVRGRTLAIGRNLTGYVLAADIIGFDSSSFKSWLRDIRTTSLDNRTLIATHEERPNNWGAHAGAARIAIALYIGDDVDLDAAASVFRGYLGDREAWDGFVYGDSDWQADRSAPVPLNPPGSTVDGVDISGALVDDIRRCGCEVAEPLPKENYQWEAMQGIVAQATMLARAGYDDVWNWSDDAIMRAVTFLYERADYPPEGDDRFIPFLIDAAYGTNLADGVTAESGKSLGYTDWTHSPDAVAAAAASAESASAVPPPVPPALPAASTARQGAGSHLVG